MKKISFDGFHLVSFQIDVLPVLTCAKAIGNF